VRRKPRTLREYLDATNTRQADFARRLGLTQAAISRIANGKTTPSLRLALRIAAEAGIPVSSLVAEQEVA
jgi:transcriptional regulator with XRE-family HTH domain